MVISITLASIFGLASSMQLGGDVIYRVDGEARNDYLGQSVAVLGDVDQDGFSDFCVGSADADPNGLLGAGSVWVHSGADGSLIQRLDGDGGYDNFGMSISPMGDLNGDGIEDFVVGAQREDSPWIDDVGAAHVISGATGQSLLTVYGTSNEDDLFGCSVAAGLDFTGDGVPDFVVGSRRADYVSRNAGSVFCYSGASGQLVYRFDGNSLEDELGGAVALVGDWDGDGHAEIAAGMRYENSNGFSNNGSVFVWSGRTGALLRRFDGAETNDLFGSSIARAGDVNGDRVDDIAIGAPSADPNGSYSGSTYVYSGATGALLYRFDGSEAGDNMGHALSAAGDLNGDGFDDVFVSADEVDSPSNILAGAVYAFSGADGSTLFTFEGEGLNDNFGHSISTSEDLDLDGYPDVVIGAVEEDPGGVSNAGSAFVMRLGPLAPRLSVAGSCPGQFVLSATSLTPSGAIAFVYGWPGSFTVPNGPCSGLRLDLQSPELAGVFQADPMGQFTFTSPWIPTRLCGIAVQVVDVGTCLASQAVLLE